MTPIFFESIYPKASKKGRKNIQFSKFFKGWVGATFTKGQKMLIFRVNLREFVDINDILYFLG